MVASEHYQEIIQLIEKFKGLAYPDRELTKNLLKRLRLYDIVDLEFALNKKIPRERLAAVNMIEKYLEDLCSENHAKFAEAKETLRQIYYKVYEMEEEGSL